MSTTPLAKMTLDDFREYYRRYCLSVRNNCDDTVRMRFISLERFFAHFEGLDCAMDLFKQITPSTVTDFLLGYASAFGSGSRQNMHSALRVFLRFAYVEGFVPQDLSALVPTVRRWRLARLPRALPDECICALEGSIDCSTAAGKRDSAIICLLSTYGVRGVQLRRLCLEDIDWENERIFFPAAKRGRAIEQHLTVRAGNRLADYIANGRGESSLPEVFLSLKTPAPLNGSTSLSGMISRRLKRAGLSAPEGVSCGTHGLRHAFAVRMTGLVPFKDVVDMLGHRDPSSTLIYAKADVRTLQEAALPWPEV